MTAGGDVRAQPDAPGPGFPRVALACGIAAAVVFLTMPDIDIAVSGLFYRDDGTFAFALPGVGRAMRDGFNLLFLSACVVVIAGFLSTGFGRPTLIGLAFPHWLYLALSFAVGPGLLANAILKDLWGRARPRQIEAFGGEQIFRPPLLFSDQCQFNCSFIAGEASSIFMLFFALALAVPAWRRVCIAAALVLGTGAGLVRIGAGGHFLSDVVFAGVLMALVAWLLHWGVMQRGAALFATGGPVQGAIEGAGRRLYRRWRDDRGQRPKAQ